MKLKVLSISFFLLFNTDFPQDKILDSLCARGIKEIYNIRFEEAEKTFRSIIADFPDHPSGRFFLAMIDWWKIMLNPDNESYDDIFFQKLEDVIYQCDEILDKNRGNVDALFFKGGAIGFRGRLRAFRESWIKAADDAREALPIVQRASELDPDNVDVQLGFGIYNYYAAVIPEEYPLIKPLMIFFPPGDKEKGIKQLNDTAMKGKFAMYEARYFLMTLYFNYENNPYKAAEYASMLKADFPNNPVFERWAGRIEAKKGDYSAASKIFRNILFKADKGIKGFGEEKSLREAYYYVGYDYRNKGQLDSARYFFSKCADISKKIDKEEESGFLINSYLYLGMINDLLGKRKEAENYYRGLLEMREYGKSHILAKEYLGKPYKQ
jgi:tetratricopeptide (TPR) repeat protein